MSVCMFNSEITLKIWFQKGLQWITELFFSFFRMRIGTQERGG